MNDVTLCECVLSCTECTNNACTNFDDAEVILKKRICVSQCERVCEYTNDNKENMIRLLTKIGYRCGRM